MTPLQLDVLFFLCLYDFTDEGGPIKGWTVGQLACFFRKDESLIVEAILKLQAKQCVYARKKVWLATSHGSHVIQKYWETRREDSYKGRNAKRWISQVRSGITAGGSETKILNAAIPKKLETFCGSEDSIEDQLDRKRKRDSLENQRKKRKRKRGKKR